MPQASLVRIQALIAAAIILVLLFAACAAPAAPAPTAAPTKAAAAPTAAPAAPTTAPAPAATKPAAAAPTTAPAAAVKPTKDKVKVGFYFDASGPTSNVGPLLRDGAKDFIEYMNANKGGANGHPIEMVIEDHKYEVPLAVAIYKRWVEQEKIQMLSSYGTPITEALSPSAAKDKVPLLTPGYGLSESADGKKFPYTFVGVASYNAQMAAALQFVKNNWKESRNAKVAFLYYDNPAGNDPREFMKKLAPKLGIDIVTEVTVPPTAVDTGSQWLEVQKSNPDWVLNHMFGRPASIVLKDRGRLGIKTPTLTFVWGMSEQEIDVAGADSVEGTYVIQFAAAAGDKPEAMESIKQWYQSQGKPQPQYYNTIYYARGVAIGTMIHGGIANAPEPVTGETIKKGLESTKNYTGFGMLSPTTLTADDHGGSRMVRIYQAQKGQLVRVQDWFEGPSS